MADEPETGVELLAVGERILRRQVCHVATLHCFPSILLTLCLCCCHQALNLAENNSCNNDVNNFFINKEPVVMDTVATSQTVIATLKMLHGEPDDRGVLQLSQHWAVENPALFADFFIPANMTFAIAAEVGANLATFMPSRRLDFEDSNAADEVGSAAN
jgi:hypothetical protein